MAKIAATLRGMHNVKSLQSTGRRSIPPTSKSAFLDLFMLMNKKDRLLQEKTRIRGRREQISNELSAISKNMGKLFKVGVQTMKGGKVKNDSADTKIAKKHNGSTVLEY